MLTKKTHKMSDVTHICILLSLVVLMYCAWMDVALYYKLQSHPENLLLTQNYVAEKENGASATTTTSSESYTQSFDPFNPISLKLLMLDHLNHYIYYPIGSWLDVDILHISQKLTFITPDMISLSHVMVAGVAAKFVSSEILLQRRIGVLLFELRSFLDSLDGLVARSRSKQRAMIADHTQWGYWMDGFCDLIGTIFFMMAVLVICQRSLSRRTTNFHLRPVVSWLPFFQRRASWPTYDQDTEAFLPSSNNNCKTSASSTSGPSSHLVMSFKQCNVIVASLCFLQFISSYFWNRYMENYHMLLEVPMQTKMTSTGTAETFQLETMRSAAFWIIVWSWRLLNPHALMSVLLVSIFFDKGVEMFLWLQCLGYVPLLGLIATTEVHLQATGWKIWYLVH